MRTPNEILETNLVVSHYSGSLAYGTNLPTSDIDIRGIFVADKEYYFSPWASCNELTIKGQDTKFYEIQKYLSLLVDQNPNIVESLWVDSYSVIKSSAAYEYLRENREKLLSSKCKFTYSGYAYEQLKRIKGHKKWINNPKEVKPKQIEYTSLVYATGESDLCNISFHRINGNVLGCYEAEAGAASHFNDDYSLNILKEKPKGKLKYIINFNKEQYDHDLNDYNNYWEWKNKRNKTRNELEEKFGYDTKHGMHLIRLLRTAKEILSEGVVKVKRPDYLDLLEIRNGKYSYDEIIALASDYENEVDQLYKTTSLRKSVNVKEATKVLFRVQNLIWEENNAI
jgi:predicted nucleotidyltransferase